MSDLNTLVAQWVTEKSVEANARKCRVALEKQILDLLEVDQSQEGTTKVNELLQVSVRHTRTVDAERIQALASQHGLSHHLATLCRFKVDRNKRAWDAASPEITDVLADAITTKPAKPVFKFKGETES